MDELSIIRALDGLPLGVVRFFEKIGSTNDYAGEWAASGAPDLALVIADEQTAGRGRLGRKWFTSPGASLAFSLLLRSGGFPGLVGASPQKSEDADINLDCFIIHLTALGAIAVCQTLRADHGLQAEIKWPNDVLLNRRKAAGVLVEAKWVGNELHSVVLGIGVNVASAAVPADDQVIYPATSVEGCLGKPVDRLNLLRSILRNVLAWRSKLFSPEFHHSWEELLAFRREWVEAAIPAADGSAQNNEQLSQKVQVLGLDQAGGLRLRNPNGQVFSLKDSEFRLRGVP